MLTQESAKAKVVLNLIPDNIIAAGISRRKREKKIALSLAAAGGICFLSLLLFFLQYFMVEQKASGITGRISELRPKMEIIRRLSEEKKNFESGINMVSEFTRGKVSWLEVMRELSVITPENVWFTNLDFGRDGKINISGEAMSNSLVEELKSGLKDSAYFERVNLISVNQSRKKGREGVNFRLHCYAVVGVEKETFE